MDKRVRIWNVLHDGQITAVSGENTDTLTMFVNIPYLRRRLKPLGDSFVLTLEGLSFLKFENFDGSFSSLQEKADIGVIEILSIESETMPVRIYTTGGQITLEFKNIRFALDTGQELEYESIEKACEEYWTEWSESAQHNRKKK